MLKNLSREFSAIAAYTVFSLYFYFLMEWLFFATKPSFMSSLAVSAKFFALVIPPALFFIPFLCAIALLRLLSGVIESATGFNVFPRIAPLLPALPLAACLFIVADTFSYTLFQYGVISTDESARYLYIVWILFLVLISFVFFYRKANAPASPASRRGLAVLAGILLIVSALEAVRALVADPRTPSLAAITESKLEHLPNILLISSDGIDASNVSAYGYERDTTPFLRARLKDALVVENAFPNAPGTRSSLASMFTGKLPTTNGLLSIVGILQGKHAYQHFPGILRNLGYQSTDIVFHSVGGAFNFNLRNSFDVSGSRTIHWQKFSFPEPLSLVFANAEFMIGEVVDRLRSRLFHIFFAKKMVDEFEELVHARKEFLRASADHVRTEALYKFIETASEPFFVHVHFMGTHGPKFEIAQPQFSKGQEQTEEWMGDFYDDSILQFDGYVAEMFRRLEHGGKLANSIIVINTDHSKGNLHSKTHSRLPLLFFFPNNGPKGRVKSNAQLLDVAPTLLDYLGVDKPNWMEGESLLRGEPDRLRRIISVYAARNEGQQISLIKVVVCNRIYSVRFSSQLVGASAIRGHTDPCTENELPDRDEIKKFVFEHLKSSGLDLSRDVRQAK